MQSPRGDLKKTIVAAGLEKIKAIQFNFGALVAQANSCT